MLEGEDCPRYTFWDNANFLQDLELKEEESILCSGLNKDQEREDLKFILSFPYRFPIRL